MSQMQWFVDMISPYCTEEQIGVAVAVVAVGLVFTVMRFITFALFPKR
jgi:hypothetical protein